MEGTEVVTVTDSVQDRAGRPRWVVVATFVGVDGGEPRCVDYRVRVVPEGPDGGFHFHAYARVMVAMEEQAAGPEDVAELGSIPAEGIPRYVFERASQTRMLEKARAKVERQPDLVSENAAQLLARQNKPRRGRPPVRSLGEKLRILAAVEAAYAAGRTLQDVADDHFMSRSAVRDIVAWGRSSDSGAQLFTGTTPGRRSGGRLTDEGRELLRKGVE